MSSFGDTPVQEGPVEGTDAAHPESDASVLQELVDLQVANMYQSVAGDAGEDPRFLAAPDKEAEEVEPRLGERAKTDIWEEVYPQNASTPTYVLRYRQGDTVPATWDLPPRGSVTFEPDFSQQPVPEGRHPFVHEDEFYARDAAQYGPKAGTDGAGH